MLSAKRDDELTGRLRSRNRHPTVRAWTNLYKNSVIPYELSNYQSHLQILCMHACISYCVCCVCVRACFLNPAFGCQNLINVYLRWPHLQVSVVHRSGIRLSVCPSFVPTSMRAEHTQRDSPGGKHTAINVHFRTSITKTDLLVIEYMTCIHFHFSHQ